MTSSASKDHLCSLNDAELEDVMKRLEAMDLILPSQLLLPMKISDSDSDFGNSENEPGWELHHKTLRGYKTLQELREKVSNFRQGEIR